jgi:hypothetical protein
MTLTAGELSARLVSGLQMSRRAVSVSGADQLLVEPEAIPLQRLRSSGNPEGRIVVLAVDLGGFHIGEASAYPRQIGDELAIFLRTPFLVGHA